MAKHQSSTHQGNLSQDKKREILDKKHEHETRKHTSINPHKDMVESDGITEKIHRNPRLNN